MFVILIQYTRNILLIFSISKVWFFKFFRQELQYIYQVTAASMVNDKRLNEITPVSYLSYQLIKATTVQTFKICFQLTTHTYGICVTFWKHRSIFFNNLHVWSLYSFYAAVLLREDSVPVCCDAFALIMFSLWKRGERLSILWTEMASFPTTEMQEITKLKF